MIEFQTHPDCTKCTLCESATNVGIPTREFDVGLATQRRALLIVGQTPEQTRTNLLKLIQTGNLG